MSNKNIIVCLVSKCIAGLVAKCLIFLRQRGYPQKCGQGWHRLLGMATTVYETANYVCKQVAEINIMSTCQEPGTTGKYRQRSKTFNGLSKHLMPPIQIKATRSSP